MQTAVPAGEGVRPLAMIDGEWVLSWRMVLTREWGWPGQRVLAFDVLSVEHLREVVLPARRDPSIATYRYWRQRH